MANTVSTRRTAPRGHRSRRPPGEDARSASAPRARSNSGSPGPPTARSPSSWTSEYTRFHDVHDELGRLDRVTTKRAARLRDLEAARLDRLTQALEPGITAGDPRAILAAVRVMERRAKLFGLDAPTTLAGPDGPPMSIRIVHQQLPE